MEQRASSLAEVDKLNIIFFGEMDISSEEKKLRVVMAADFQKLLLKYYDTVQNINTLLNNELDGAAALYAAAAAEFARGYILFFTKYYPQYLALLGEGNVKGVVSWAYKHSRELAEWIPETGLKGNAPPIYDRILTTSRTEVNAIGNLALMHSAVSKGKTRKRWKTFGDNRVRQTHREASGQTVAIDKPFIIGGSRMMFPCDTSLGASAAEIVNCRCTVQYL